ncbi:single-stranded DNA-binding protein [Microbacterium sp. C7(2022)]|uniref:single-stranded DNA-binding protein n=1 Tax=Microbacterium sp. C7(2022) TaxID=2992759 RepID=UPI00237BE86D|nr:single-stranded DNA-binding protein [Microbacterium sp. C7(2022)]MDE0545947.1 single-stranded DNA-binding protein [Microbacterium sp. C7(2022)]
MSLHTQQSVSGFIASDPQRSITENGDTRLYVRIGQPHFRRNDDGSFTELDPSFHDLVAYRVTAERALSQLQKGDSFVAEGYIRSFAVEREGHSVEAEEFVAKRIGHDTARTNYVVDRTRRAARELEGPTANPISPTARNRANAPALGL